jgi:hypothetical protein
MPDLQRARRTNSCTIIDAANRIETHSLLGSNAEAGVFATQQLRAVAAAIAEDSKLSTSSHTGDMKMDSDANDDTKKADADHSRRPISKDTTKIQRQRPRAQAVKKKTKKSKAA